MYCRYCGALIADNAAVCPQCRQVLTVDGQQPQDSFQAQREAAPQEYQQPVYAPQQTAYAQNYQQPAVQQPAQKMGWFKFIVNFALFASALLMLINGITQMTGLVYEGSGASAEQVYAVFSGMKALDVTVGLMFILLAVFAVITRFRLAKFKVFGPEFLYMLYGASLLINILYLVLASVLTGLNLATADVIAQLATSAIMMIVNIIYFNKRKALFVN